jgi:GTP-binding protein
MLDFRRSQFLTSAPNRSHWPPDVGVEAAFAGRSNAGKSSALNVITDQRQLARVSKTPGRTQLINFFTVDAERRLVDLPGYGYAKVTLSVRADWQRMVGDYLQQRQSLRGLMLLMDIRQPLTELDHELLAWCRVAALPVHILLSKADKLNRGPGLAVLRQVEASVAATGGTVSVQLFSALKREGIEVARAVLSGWLGAT